MASNTSSNVLFVDDDEQSINSLTRALERREASFSIHSANNSTDALEKIVKIKPEVAVVDLSLDPNIGPDSGLNLIGEILQLDTTVRILVLTGHGSEEIGVRALQFGAASFLLKPIDASHLQALINDGINFSNLKRQFQKLNTTPEYTRNIKGLQSKSAIMGKVVEDVCYAATNNQPVLITGETGTGKGVLAQAIHTLSERHARPFIRVQPTFGSSDLITSELFGHEKGAFTGAAESRSGLIEEADMGTLFIDEIDELPHDTQVLLLNVLQEKMFRRVGSNKEKKSNFRLVSATNRTIEEILAKEKLRQDFFHRIAHFRIEIPALRERIEDIPQLARDVVTDIANRESLQVQGLTDKAIAKLSAYNWPGNIRELQAIVEGGVYRATFHSRNFVEAGDIEINKRPGEATSTGMSFRERINAFELQIIREALQKNDNNQSKAAASLQLDRTTMRRILKRLDSNN